MATTKIQNQFIALALLAFVSGAIPVAVWKDHQKSILMEELEKEKQRGNELDAKVTALELARSQTASTRPREVSSPAGQVANRFIPSVYTTVPYPSDPIARAKLGVKLAYGRILDRLQLSTEQREVIENLLIERGISARDARALAGKQKLGVTEADRIISQMNDEIDAKIERHVSAADYKTIKDMLDYSPGLNRAQGLADLQGQDPYSLGQLIGLAKVFTEKSRENPTQNKDSVSTIDIKTGLSAHDRNIMAQASLILTPSQLARLQEDLAAKRSSSVELSKIQETIKAKFERE
jgi:hypothetical protein